MITKIYNIVIISIITNTTVYCAEHKEPEKVFVAPLYGDQIDQDTEE